MMTDENLEQIIKALANPVRREILQWLKQPEQEFTAQPNGFEQGVCVGRIFAKSGLSQSTVSSHLALMQRTGLLNSQRRGQWVYYQRNEAVIREFAEQIQQTL